LTERKKVTDGLDFAREVVSGERPSNAAVRAVCERSLHEHEHGHELWVHDPRPYERLKRLVSKMRYVTGPLKGEPVSLVAWQRYVFHEMLGWVDRADHAVNRFREVILHLPRQQGKTLFAAVAGLYYLFSQPNGTKIATAATQQKQARIAWEYARDLCETVPNHMARSRESAARIELGRSAMFATSREKNALHGHSISLFIVDEAALIADRTMFEEVRQGQRVQKTYCNLLISTSQPNNSVFRERVDDHWRRVARRDLQDRSFILSFMLEDDDDDLDPAVWPKSNPSLGDHITVASLTDATEDSRSTSDAVRGRMTYMHNRWNASNTDYVSLDDWRGCVGELRRVGPLCVGIDLSTRINLTAAAAVWNNGPNRSVEMTHWTTNRYMDRLHGTVTMELMAAYERGELLIQDTDVVDTNEVRDHVLRLRNEHGPLVVGVDPAHGQDLISSLHEEDDVEVMVVRQTSGVLSYALGHLQRDVASRTMTHQGHGLMEFELQGLDVRRNRQGQLSLFRHTSDTAYPIDGWSALVNAYSLLNTEPDPTADFHVVYRPMDWSHAA